MDRIILAFASEKAHAQLTRTLGSGGLVPTVSCFSGAEAIRAARKLGSAVVICGFHLRDMTAELLAADLAGIAPVLVVSSPGNLALCGDENLIKLAVPAMKTSSSWRSPPPARSSSPLWTWPGAPSRTGARRRGRRSGGAAKKSI